MSSTLGLDARRLNWVISKDVKSFTYCYYVRCATLIVLVEGNALAPNGRNALPCTVRNYRQCPCNQRLCCLLCIHRINSDLEIFKNGSVSQIQWLLYRRKKNYQKNCSQSSIRFIPWMLLCCMLRTNDLSKGRFFGQAQVAYSGPCYGQNSYRAQVPQNPTDSYRYITYLSHTYFM